MNKERRKRIEEAIAKLSEAKSDIEDIQSEEQEYLDNMPENMQQGEKADAAQTAISSMDDAMNYIDDAMSSLEEANG